MLTERMLCPLHHAGATRRNLGAQLRKVMSSRRARLIRARLRMFVYLLFRGMWRGECALFGYDKSTAGRLVFIAAATGSITQGTLQPVRVFWDETSGTPP